MPTSLVLVLLLALQLARPQFVSQDSAVAQKGTRALDGPTEALAPRAPHISHPVVHAHMLSILSMI